MKERNIIPVPKDDRIFLPDLSLSIQGIVIQGHLCFLPVKSVWSTRAELQLVHRQFAHKPIHQLVRHFPKGTFSRDDFKMLSEIYKQCKDCQLHAHLGRRPRTALPKPVVFNRMIAFDIYHPGKNLPDAND